MSGALPRPDVDRFAALLAAAGDRARARARRVLVSLSLPAPDLDPLAVLESVVHAARSDASLAARVADGRMYWTRPCDAFALAGLGTVATFGTAGPGRFASVDREWDALLEGALLDDATDGGTAVGPVLMGGFAFEPHGPRNSEWSGFPAAHLILPRLLLARTGAACSVTLSAILGADGVPDIEPDELARLYHAALSASGAPAPRRPEPAAPVDPLDAGLAFSSPVDAPAWEALVEAGVSAIRAGSLQKVVLAREVRAEAPRDVDVFALLRHLRAAHRDCFVFGYWRGERAFVGASPERLVRLDGREVRASSLAGSTKRGSTAGEDAALAAALLASAKDQGEHAAVRQALGDGLAELCDDVVAEEEPSLLTLRHVHHLHTAVRATLRPGHSLLELLARLHPTPAVGGTPREAALRFIRDRERLDRGWYAAPIGWVGRQNGEFAVGLRSAVIAGRVATLFAGCGIVADSVPELEYAESLLKLRPMQAALAAALADASSLPAGAGVVAERAS